MYYDKDTERVRSKKFYSIGYNPIKSCGKHSRTISIA